MNDLALRAEPDALNLISICTGKQFDHYPFALALQELADAN